MTRNPFEFSAANDLKMEQILDYYIEDFNYSRFIQSKRNVFLLGERGSGKTMTLLFNSFEAQYHKAKREGTPPSVDRIGVYIPCNTPLTHRREHELLNRFQAATLSEHVLVLSIVHRMIKTLEETRDALGEVPDDALSDELEAILAKQLPPGPSFLSRVSRFLYAENQRTHQAVNRATEATFYEGALSFATLAMPVLEVLGRIAALRETHFHLMLDDADYLNEYQISALNSWIAYRDHSRFSFKVATAKVNRPSLITSTDGSILEGHDFTVVDMEKPFHNDQSDFGHLATQIVKRRLERIGCSKTPQEFFPVSKITAEQLEEAKVATLALAREKYPEGTPKQISDFVYKYHRANYFRRRQKANLPIYSGFDMLVYLSTGVVRNLLEPCYWMYDKALSVATERGEPIESITSIDPTYQNEVIMSLSQRAWDQIEHGLNTQVAGCTLEQAGQLKHLFEALAQHFRDRLHSDCSEPRATSFTVSGRDSDEGRQLDALLNIARKALLIYTRGGTAKEAGSRETYYVPKRMLWPIRGLDPHGQHARVSLKARDLLAAARGDRNPWSGAEDAKQGRLF